MGARKFVGHILWMNNHHERLKFRRFNWMDEFSVSFIRFGKAVNV
jgi:hypothetical protein